MSEDELKAIEAEDGGCSNCFALVREVRRLRGLIKSAEHCGVTQHSEQPRVNCPWCAYDTRFQKKHAPDCPAFTESGDVR